MRIGRALTAGLLLGLALAGCAGGGDDGTDGVASAGGTPTPSTSAGTVDEGQERENMLKFAQCMRENGVPEFPDPEFQEGGVGLALPRGADKAKVDAAQAECKQYLPNGGEAPKADPERIEQARKFAQCMRDNGVPDFPDPRADGGIALDGDQVDPEDPTFKAAHDKCRAAHLPDGGGGTKSQRRSDT